MPAGALAAFEKLKGVPGKSKGFTNGVCTAVIFQAADAPFGNKQDHALTVAPFAGMYGYAN